MTQLIMPVVCECGFNTMDSSKAYQHASDNNTESYITYRNCNKPEKTPVFYCLKCLEHNVTLLKAQGATSIRIHAENDYKGILRQTRLLSEPPGKVIN